MEISILKMPDGIARWNLVVDYLRMRTAVFIDDIGWDLNTADTIEYEQYDVGSGTVYIIGHEAGRVIGGARLVRCDNSVGNGRLKNTYMINDAFHGKITLPPNICWDAPPTDAKSWELSRLVAIENKGMVGKQLLDTANAYIKMHGGERCLFLGWHAFLRMAKRYGYAPRQLGDVVTDEGKPYVAFECPVI